jgi:hypothetical protein
MPILLYHNSEGPQKEFSFKEEISIGSDAERCGIVLPGDSGIAPWHAVIIRSALTRAPVLINLAGQNTWVNERPVIGVQVLRQRDVIRLAQIRLSLWEVRITRLELGNRFIGKECLVCQDIFKAGEKVIHCPHCDTPSHRDCWFAVKKCPNYTCGYHSQASTINVLSTSVQFEFKLQEDSPLVEIKGEDNLLKQEGRKCAAGTRRDKVAFQTGNNVAYCPAADCRTPYHLECWLMLDTCVACGYDVRQIIDQVFSVNLVGDQKEENTHV